MEKDELYNESSSPYDSDDSEVSVASDYQPHAKARKKKCLRSKRSRYHSVSNELRSALIKLVVDERKKIKPTAKELGINYSTAKSILQIYRKEGRIDKKLLGSEEDEVSLRKNLELKVERVEKEHSKPEETLTNRRYPLRERKNAEERNLIVEVVTTAAKPKPKPKDQSVEPKLKKVVKKDLIELAEHSVASTESRGSEIKEELSKQIESGSEACNYIRDSHTNQKARFQLSDISNGISSLAVRATANNNNNTANTTNNTSPKPFKSNVGFVAVKPIPRELKTIEPAHNANLLSQSWIPLIFSPNHQINPISLINLGLCGFFKFQN